VTGKELDRGTMAQLRTLDGRNGEWVSKHLVMAGRLIDINPELAFEHALAASRRGGRIGAVREAVGMTAYAAGHYDDALREFRTFRRITGSSIHLPHMADCERGLGRPEKALELTRSEERDMLDTASRVELAIVASGARSDMGDLAGAVEELEIPQLDINRAFSFSPRLFEAYADALSAAGRADEAAKWYRQIGVAESALGVGEFSEPDILDLGEDEEDEADLYVGSDEDDEPREEALAGDESVAEAGESEDAMDSRADDEGPAAEEAALAEDEIGVTERDESELAGSDGEGEAPGSDDA
jgi:tetratricopeptide (TPR) repeat protein